MAKRVSNAWKTRVEDAENTLRRTVGQVSVDTDGHETVTEAFMRQFAIVECAKQLKAGAIKTPQILAALREEKSGLPVLVG